MVLPISFLKILVLSFTLLFVLGVIIMILREILNGYPWTQREHEQTGRVYNLEKELSDISEEINAIQEVLDYSDPHRSKDKSQSQQKHQPPSSPS